MAEEISGTFTMAFATTDEPIDPPIGCWAEFGDGEEGEAARGPFFAKRQVRRFLDELFGGDDDYVVTRIADRDMWRIVDKTYDEENPVYEMVPVDLLTPDGRRIHAYYLEADDIRLFAYRTKKELLAAHTADSSICPDRLIGAALGALYAGDTDTYARLTSVLRDPSTVENVDIDRLRD